MKKKKTTFGVVRGEVEFICFPPFSDITVLQNSESLFSIPFFFSVKLFFYYVAREFPILPLPSPPFWSLFHSFFFPSSKSDFSFQHLHRTKKGYCVEFLFFSLGVLSLYIRTLTPLSLCNRQPLLLFTYASFLRSFCSGKS